MKQPKAFVPGWLVGEVLGTFLLVFFGCGSVATAVLTGAQVGIFQVAIVWGIGIATAIYLTASLSGAHLNPAVTIAFATWGSFQWKMVPRYLAAQLLGAMIASVVLYGIYQGKLVAYEATHAIVRGTAGSEASAMIFGEYFPNPGGLALTDSLRGTVSAFQAFFIEMIGTGILVLVIFACTDETNESRPRTLVAVTIGLTVTILISLLGPLTMAGFNPARDFGPRLFSALAGWGNVAFETNGNGWFTVYILAPVAGGLLGGGIYRWFLAPHYLVRSKGETA